ncbi:hypothetical protein [Streptomyces kaniharaensis]|uniref:hypothetical protein n=1 Tax=Streptomyces kaniharaensis TaxID=212423 RepID=UPI0012979D53|nr:hypothetical protein [Streptomyces kaniharaensis]
MPKAARIVVGFAAAGMLMIAAAPAANAIGIGWDVAPKGELTVQASGIGWD